MKLRTGISKAPVRGYALAYVLAVAALSLTILAATLARTNTVQALNARNNQYTAGLYAAEAATEKVIARMQFDFLAGNLGYVTNNLGAYRGCIPVPGESDYWRDFGFSDAQGNVNRTYVECLSNTAWAPLESQYGTLNGWVTTYRVLSNVEQAGSPLSLTNAVQQDIQLIGIPLFQFAIFYNSLLEFTWCAPFTINGRTHANTNIFVGSTTSLKFNSTVTASGTISAPAWFGKSPNQYTGPTTYNGNPGYSTNVQNLTLPIGTNNSPDAVREILNAPPPGEDPSSPMGQERYYNKASLLLLVSNTAVNLRLQNSATDAAATNIIALYNSTNYSGIATNFPFLSVTNTFTDQRESKTVVATQIDMGKLTRWIATNPVVNAKFPNVAGTYYKDSFPNLLYVADNRTTAANQLAAVRLVNGAVIPTNAAPTGQPTGFTVATPDPMYVQGNYNSPDPAALNTTNTAKAFPASLLSDALTILSGNWKDSQSALSLGNGSKSAASDTTVNAAIVTGAVYSTGAGVNTFSGGVMNITRLLEDWGNGGSTRLTLNTSIINLFNSARATTQFQQPGVYYYAPTRQFSFDLNFMNPGKLPPGTPMLGTVARSKWCTPPPNTIDYAGN